MTRRSTPLLTLLLGALAFELSAPGAFAAAQVPLARGSILRNTARLTFEWPQPTGFTVSASGKTLTIRFNRIADPDFGSLLSALYPYVTRAQRLPDGKTLRLTLDKAYKIRTYAGGQVGSIELLGIDAGKRKALQTPLHEEHAIAAAQPVLIPSAGLEAAEPETEVKNTGGLIKVNLSAAEDSAVLRFPFPRRMGLAVFIRSGTLWVVCSEPVSFDLSDFDALPKTVVGKAQVVKGENVAVLRIPVDDNVYAAVTKEEGNLDWAVLVTPKKRPPVNPLATEVHTDPPAPPHVFIPALEMAGAVTLEDPLIGDEVIAVPLFAAGTGNPTPREFVEFSLLGSAQGIAIAKKADDVDAAEIRGGLRISLPQGATLTPGLPIPEARAAVESGLGAATLFPYKLWRLSEGLDRREEIRKLMNAVVTARTPGDANGARLRLAQVYLGEGMAVEALGMLDGIQRTNPVFYRSAKLNALRAAAEFLMYRFVDAARDFSAAELNNNKEIEYWRAMLSDLLGNSGQNYDFLAMNTDFISKYPPLMRQRLAIVAADRSVEAKEYNIGLKIFDTLRQDDLVDPIKNYVDFLVAKIAADTGDDSAAIEIWDKLAADVRHPFVWSRAEFSRVIWGMDHNTLTKDQAIDRLERVRLAYHGDGLELRILTMLGEMYGERRDYVNAMRIWDNGITGFPNTAAAIEMFHKMQAAFQSMFAEGGADTLPTLKAVALYYQYRNYAPVGSAGNEIIVQLAARLQKLDLLDQAAVQIDKQMRYQTEKEERSKLGSLLASLYLTNRQPQKALTALQDSVYGENAPSLRNQRNRVTAATLLNSGQPDRALQLLTLDETPEADRLRLDVFWQQKNWSSIASTVEKLLKARPNPAAALTDREAQEVVKLAVAYAALNDTVQLQYLRDYFGGLMQGSPHKPMFDFVTLPDVVPEPMNFDAVIENVEATRNFVNNYKARLPAPAAPAATPAAPAVPAPAAAEPSA